jgi:UDP-sulfoquinovose synthase
VENPRKEAEEHYYNPAHTGLLELGLKPHYLTDEVLEQMFRIVERYRDRINEKAIFRNIKWN